MDGEAIGITNIVKKLLVVPKGHPLFLFGVARKNFFEPLTFVLVQDSERAFLVFFGFDLQFPNEPAFMTGEIGG